MNEEIYYFYQTPDNRSLIELSLCGITFPDKNYKVRRKNSSTMCIEYIESGQGVVFTENGTFIPMAGDSYMLFIGENQFYHSDSKNPWKKYWINIKSNAIKRILDAYNLSSAHYFQGLDIKAELCEIIELSRLSDTDSTGRVLEILNRIFHKMYLHLKERRTVTLAEKVRDYLDIHSSQEFDFEVMEKVFGKSQSSIIRIFKEKFGITPYAYYLDKKIELAKGLLLNTNLLVKQIAYNLKFSDEYYFCNIFTKKVGVSPSKFRKKGGV